jgi:hypothetical protein
MAFLSGCVFSLKSLVMDDDNIDFVLRWFAAYDEMPHNEQFEFKNLEKPLYPSEQFSAVAFLYGKLKDKANNCFLHGEHDQLFIGDFEDFENFTVAELEEAAHYGISLDENDGGFQIYASM